MSPYRALCAGLRAALSIAVGACGGSESADYGGPEAAGGSGSGTGSSPEPPPEKELESSYGAPVATGKYVWIPNPESGRVAYIDAVTLAVETVDAGHGPTFVSAVPDFEADTAIVLNVLSRDATLLRAKNGALTTRSLAVPSSGNRWAISESGRFAIAWTDAHLVPGADPAEGFQDITVLDLAAEAGGSTELTVGYRPAAIAFDVEASRAFAVTQDGITVIELDEDEPVVVQNIHLSDDPLEPADAHDVAITPDGHHAVVRREGIPMVSVFSLEDAVRTDVQLPAPATDLDLLPDGTLAVAVLRDTSEVVLLPIPAITTDPTAYALIEVTDAVVGSVSLAPASSVALFYTNGIASPYLSMLNTAIEPYAPKTLLLHAPVQAVLPTPKAGHAVVLHPPTDPTAAGEGASSKYPASMSLVPLASDLPAKIVGLDAPPVSVAISPDGARAVVAAGEGAAAGNESTYRVYVASFPSLAVADYELASEPMTAGIVAGAHRGYVAQKYPDGRITFIDLDSGELRTLTGFELAAQVVDGSLP
jgi:hypothetical protein